ncbi:MAG: NUDIX hydrolase [Chloroflexi bacterium]|nr:NUDIX hydrolase [Chloroflexota bacterium]MQC25440.1 NUDIX hydrolase [Chloroflexota bacterium]MQC48545.1 NUDIX hydrolase [Chloroflexota bacterium]
MTSAPARTAVSAGGVVYRRGAEGIEIVMVSRRDPALLALPKGKVDPGEVIEATAVREVREETGLHARIVEALGEVRYWFPDTDGTRIDKVVHYFLMTPEGGSFDLHDHEFDDVGWFHIGEAERRMTHRNQLHILEQAAEAVRRIEAATR